MKPRRDRIDRYEYRTNSSMSYPFPPKTEFFTQGDLVEFVNFDKDLDGTFGIYLGVNDKNPTIGNIVYSVEQQARFYMVHNSEIRKV